MTSRKKSTTSEESSSGSTSSSSTTTQTSTPSGSASSSSESDSSSPKEQKNDSNANGRANDSAAIEKVLRRRSSEHKHGTKVEEKTLGASQKVNKVSVNRGQRLSKSSVYSSDEEPSPVRKVMGKFPLVVDRKKISEIRRSTNTNHPTAPVGGGKAPPAIVKQQQQQNFAKAVANRQNLLKAQSKPQVRNALLSKKKSIFSPENSSESENDSKTVNKHEHIKGKQVSKSKVKSLPQKKPPKKEMSKSPMCSECSSSSGNSSSSSDSDSESDSDNDSSPPAKKPAQRKALAKQKKPLSSSKTVILTDSEPDQSKIPTIRKLTRSSSTRKSKHLTGKASESESDEIDKRAASVSPVKKAPACPTKSKTKVKREVKSTTQAHSEISPIPEENKCHVEGCDSSGHLSGLLDKHFLPDACPIYHNTTAAECKERAAERKLQEEERNKAIGGALDANKKPITPEQKIYMSKIREARAKFKPVPNSSEKIKLERMENDREPKLNNIVPDYDLELFREAQAIASENMEKEVKDLPVGKGIKYITMGKYEMKVWYQSPYPEDAARQPKMYICEYCLRYQKSEVGMKRHSAKCVWRHPPGDEIYRKGKLQVWQVDGKRHKQYCQHLCLLAKFFLDHKTLYYDVEPFLFYVMTLFDSEGCHTVGYFSKEKNSFLNYNVSCILTLPPYQRKGYGRLLIDFSYLLTRVEGKIGSPEKPLSDLGLISYRSYWKDVLLDYLCKRSGTTLNIKDISQEMAIYSYDIVSTLQALGMMKYWKGKHIVLKKQDVLEEFEERVKRRGNFPKIDPACLRWFPFVPPQSSGSS